MKIVRLINMIRAVWYALLLFPFMAVLTVGFRYVDQTVSDLGFTNIVIVFSKIAFVMVWLQAYTMYINWLHNKAEELSKL